MLLVINVKNKVYKNGYRRRGCTSKTAKIHRFVTFVIYCFITTVLVAFYTTFYTTPKIPINLSHDGPPCTFYLAYSSADEMNWLKRTLFCERRLLHKM